MQTSERLRVQVRAFLWKSIKMAKDELMSARDKQMHELMLAGHSFAKIGEKYGISRERVRQCMNSLGITGKLIIAKKTALRQKEKSEKFNSKILMVYGCCADEFLKINGGRYATRNTPALKFKQQRINAKQRNIEWKLTFKEWWQIWLDSGLYSLRGKGAGYCMARKGDIGPYEIGNVYICTIGQNFSDYQSIQRSQTRR